MNSAAFHILKPEQRTGEAASDREGEPRVPDGWHRYSILPAQKGSTFRIGVRPGRRWLIFDFLFSAPAEHLIGRHKSEASALRLMPAHMQSGKGAALWI